jgi:predicted kinase
MILALLSDFDPPDFDDLLERFAWLRPLVGCPQDPRWHPEGDVWTHTVLTCQAMLEEPAWLALTPPHRAELLCAALLHDLGKPTTTKREPDGAVTSIGHSRRGSHLARLELWRLGVEPEARERICALIRLHAVPYWAMQRRGIERDILAMSLRIPPERLALLARCDARGKGTDDTERQLERIAMFSDLAAELGCPAAPFPFPSDHARVQYFRKAERDPRYEPWFEPRCTVTLTCGLPASGKSHWLREHGGHLPVVSLDALREELGVAPEEPQGELVQQARARARALLREGRDFAWDGTNLQRSRREALIGLFLDYGARVRVVHCEAPEPVLRARNDARPEPVPPAVLERMIERWEPPTPREAHEILWVSA